MPELALPERLGPYLLERRLGRGAMGEVFAAWDERLERRVAIKRLHRAEKPQRSRLLREARAAARIDHPAVVQIFDVLEAEPDLWVVMEFLDGQSLAERLREHGRLELEACRSVARQVASGLSAAHGQGVVHRDLKAENLMLLGDGRVKIVDFGIAKKITKTTQLETLGAEASTIGHVVGTTRSMAPEQALGREVDARSDLFSLGVLLYEALTGRSPFLAETPNETLVRVCSHQPPAVDEIRPEVPEDLRTLVKRLLEKDPACRPQDARAVLLALEGSGPGGVEAAQETLGYQDSHQGSHRVDINILPSTNAGAARAKKRFVVAALATTLLILLLAVGLALRSREPTSAVEERPKLRVAIESPIGEAESTMLLAVMEVGLQRALLGRQDLVVVAAERQEAIPAAPEEAASRLGVERLLRSRLHCEKEACRASLSCWRADGTLESSAEVPIAAWEPALAHETLGLAVDVLFPDHPRAANFAISDETALEDFFRMRHAYENGEWAGRESALLEQAAALRLRAPKLIEAYVFEADLLASPALRDEAALARAGSVLEAAVTLTPEDPRPALAAIRIAFAADQLVAAERLIEGLERTQPGHPSLLRYRATLASERGQSGLAVEIQKRAVARQPSLMNLYRLAALEHQAGQVDAARSTLSELLELDPEHLAGLWLSAQLELLHGEPSRAAQLYEQLKQKRPHFVVSANLGVSLLLADQPAQALENLEAALAERPSSASVQLNLADALALLEQHEQANDAYRRVLYLLDEHPQGDEWQRLSTAAQAHVHLGEKIAAAESIGRALALAPDSPQVAYEAALVYTLLGEPSSAAAHRKRAMSLGIAPSWFEAPFFTRH